MKPSRCAAAALIAALALPACKSPEQKLIDRRTELRERLDELYGTYAGAGAKPTGAVSAEDEGVVGRFIAGVERTQFDEYCLATGRGERPFALSGKLERFMRQPENARACRKAAELQLDVEKLEAQVHPR